MPGRSSLLPRGQAEQLEPALGTPILAGMYRFRIVSIKGPRIKCAELAELVLYSESDAPCSLTHFSRSRSRSRILMTKLRTSSSDMASTVLFTFPRAVRSS